MTLSERLQKAAIERAGAEGAEVDGCVIGPEGVLDLRVAITNSTDSPIRSMPKLPEVGESDVEDLYSD